MTASNIPLTRDIARKVLATVDAGLSPGLGRPIPGQMCVEAAVCFAYGLPHSDNPPCVAPVVRSLKIALNDKAWSSNAARAKGMRRIAIAQLGTADILDERLFISRIAEMTIRKVVPMALHAAASLFVEGASKDALEAAAALCEVEGTKDAAYAAVRAAYAAVRAPRAARAAYALSLIHI